MMQTNKFAPCLPRLCAQSKRDTLQREQICINVCQICLFAEVHKRSKCKVDITFTSHLRANTTGINICVCIIIAFNANLSQIWNPKFASYLLQMQIRLKCPYRQNFYFLI